MSLEDFVSNVFGQDSLSEMLHIRRGGDNNSKGSVYEQFFAVASICKLAANDKNLDEIIVSAQELAFVDDFTIRRLSAQRKDNYQLKNSTSAAADWSKIISSRFERQHQIDTQYHKFAQSWQSLVVPCSKVVNRNTAKIPQSLRDKACCELFPYKPNSYELLKESSELRGDLAKLCATSDFSSLDNAFKYVLSVWVGDNTAQSVESILTKAEKLAKPNIFRKAGVSVPGWLEDKVSSFQGMVVTVEYGHFIVSYSGFQVALGLSFNVPSTDELNSLSTARSFMQFLMRTMQAELDNGDE